MYVTRQEIEQLVDEHVRVSDIEPDIEPEVRELCTRVGLSIANLYNQRVRNLLDQLVGTITLEQMKERRKQEIHD